MPKAAASVSASTIMAGTASGYHLLTIDGYSRTKDVPNGTFIKSRSFVIGGHSWNIEYYPNGTRPGSADSISLYLRLEGNVTQAVKAQFKFILLDKTGKPTWRIQTSETRSFLNQSWGFEDFIKRDALEKFGHINDDAFTIRCDLTVISQIRTEDTEIPGPFLAVPVPPSDLAQHLGSLLLSGEAADVTFSIGGETIAAHRCVLAARSSVFKAELLGDMKEGTTTCAIPIADMEANVFKAMLCFIYTDSLQETMAMMSNEDAALLFQHLFAAADRYNLPRLKLTCENKLREHIDVETAATVLALAEQHHCHVLKKACLEFLVCPANLKAVMATDGFEHLARSCLSTVKELIAKVVN